MILALCQRNLIWSIISLEGCAAAPYLSTFLASVITAISASAASAGAMLIPLIPKFVQLVEKYFFSLLTMVKAKKLSFSIYGVVN